MSTTDYRRGYRSWDDNWFEPRDAHVRDLQKATDMCPRVNKQLSPECPVEELYRRNDRAAAVVEEDITAMESEHERLSERINQLNEQIRVISFDDDQARQECERLTLEKREAARKAEWLAMQIKMAKNALREAKAKQLCAEWDGLFDSK